MFNTIKERVYKTNTKGNRLAQTDQNCFRENAMKAILQTLPVNENLTVTQVVGGFILEFANDELGAIPVMFSLVVKPLDLDVETLHAEFVEKEHAKAVKLQTKEKPTVK